MVGSWACIDSYRPLAELRMLSRRLGWVMELQQLETLGEGQHSAPPRPRGVNRKYSYQDFTRILLDLYRILCGFEASKDLLGP